MRFTRYLLIVAVSLLPLATHASSLDYLEDTDRITKYHADIIVRPDGVLDVQETITYQFGYPGHGIVRMIPYVYKEFGFNNNIDIELSKVSHTDGKPYPVHTSSSNGYVEWKIGDADKAVVGEQTYVINYTVQWAMLYGERFDELYWNVTGNDWLVPIDLVTTTIHLPAGAEHPDLEPICYTGAYNSTEQDCSVEMDGDVITYQAKNLLQGDGLTIDVALTPHVIKQPSALAVGMHLAANNWSLFFIPLVFVFWIFALVNTKQPKSNKPLIPIYEAPDGVTRPAQAEWLMNGAVTSTGVTAELVELARQGYVQFVYDPVQKNVGQLKRTEKSLDAKHPSYALLNGLFPDGTHEVNLKRSQKLYTVVTTLHATIKQELLASDWINQKLRRRQLWINGLMLVLFICGCSLAIIGHDKSATHAVITGSIICVLEFVYALRRGMHYLALSQLGANTKQLLKGFKWFLKVTEEERLKFTQAPKLTPQLFEIFLPYAIVFGVEKQWAKQFEHILTEPPSWLVGAPRGFTGWSNAVFAVGHTQSQFRAPSNSARSGGFSGGGFSGGGFGGGGGGRW